MSYIPYGRQDVTEGDVEAVIRSLTSDFLTQGPAVPRFEAALTEYTGARYAVAVNSATSALHIACLALGLGKGDRLWTSPNTFVASANCALYCGAEVDFVDIDPNTYNMCADALAAKLKVASREGTLPKIVVPVHFAGQCCDMRAIRALADEYGFRIIEDASHAVGGKYLGQPVGNCRFSDVTVFSFHPVKIITTAEGGISLTNNPTLAERMQLFRSHGVTREQTLMERPEEGAWHYEQIALGYNYRLTDLQAALGISQLDRLDQYVKARHELARRYDALLSGMPVITPFQFADSLSALHLYPIRLDKHSSRRRAVFDHLRSAGIGVNVHYIPVHTQPYYQRLGFRPGDFPVAEAYYSEALSLPMYPKLTESQQDFVVATLKEALE